MVPKASEDLPEPETPVKTTRASRGMSTSMFRRLCSRAPRTCTMRSLGKFVFNRTLCWVGCTLLEKTQPPVTPPCLDPGEPKAHWVKRNDDGDPKQLHHGQPKTKALRVQVRGAAHRGNRMKGEPRGGRAISHIGNDYHHQVNEVEVQDEIKHRHPAKHQQRVTRAGLHA